MQIREKLTREGRGKWWACGCIVTIMGLLGLLTLVCISVVFIPRAGGGVGRDPGDVVERSTHTATASAVEPTANTATPAPAETEAQSNLGTSVEEAAKTATPEAGPLYTASDDPCERVVPELGGGGGRSPTGDIDPGSAVRLRLGGHESVVARVAYSLDGRWIATQDPEQVRLWHADSGRMKQIAPIDGNGVTTMAFSQDSQMLLLARQEGGVELRSVEDGTITRQLATEESNWFLRAALSPDGELVATGTYQLVQLWDVASGREVRRIEGTVISDDPPTISGGPANAVSSLAFSPDGTVLLVAGQDDAVRLHDVASGEHLRCYEAPGDFYLYQKALFTPDGRQVIAHTDGALLGWDALTGELLPWAGEIGTPWGPLLTDVAARPDGQAIVATYDDHLARVWSLADGQLLKVLRHAQPAVSAAYSPDGLWIVVGQGQWTDEPAPAEAWVWDAGHRDLVLAAAAQRMAEEGVRLALEGDLEGAEEALSRAGQMNPNPTVNLEEIARFHATRVLLARLDPTDTATRRRQFEQIMALNPFPATTLSTDYHETLAQSMLEQAAAFVEDGLVDEALAFYQASEGTEEARRSWQVDDICYYGALWGRPADVLPVCETYVASAESDAGHAAARATRGIARALLGNRAGAIEDFQYYVDFFGDQPNVAVHVARRQAWLDALRAGENPFDEATLQALREE